MTFEIDLSKVQNIETWISAAKEAASHPDDFKLWKKLIELSDYLTTTSVKAKQSSISTDEGTSNELKKQLVLLSYENLLVNFPLLEQYWINYAMWLYSFNDLSKAIKTFERALTIIPNSILIWNAYIDLELEINSNNDEILLHFEKARIAIGYHYYSSLFFDKYLLFLKYNKMEKEFHLLLRKLIEIPQHEYLKYYRMFINLIETASLKTIKYLVTKNELENEYNLKWVDLIDNEAFHKFKSELKKKFSYTFITIQYYSWKFFNYEQNLKTLYFKPNESLSRLELVTWKSYIEYVENLNLKLATKEREHSLIQNNTLLIESIYNRCLTITSSYPIFWIKLANYYLNYNKLESAKKVLLRGIYLNPIQNLKLRMRLVDIYIISLEFDKGKAIIYELLKLLPNNYEAFIKLLEIEHFILPSNVEKLIISKLNEIMKLNNKQLEEQFDYLFVEVLNFSCIPLTKLRKLFEKFKNKNSVSYLKGKKMFDEFYDTTLHFKSLPTLKVTPSGWDCEYF